MRSTIKLLHIRSKSYSFLKGLHMKIIAVPLLASILLSTLASCTIASDEVLSTTVNDIAASDVAVGEVEQPTENPLLDVISTILPDGTNHWPTYVWPEDSPSNNGFLLHYMTNIEFALGTCMLTRNLNQLMDSDDGYGSIIVARGGKIIYENYNGMYNHPSYKISAASIGKSIVSAVVGIAIDEGLIGGVDDRVLDYFTDWEIDNRDERKESMTIADVLSMQSGLSFPESNSLPLMRESENPVRELLGAKMNSEPGTRFNYLTVSTSILCNIIARVSGKTFTEYAYEKLFDPIGITSASWTVDPAGIEKGGSSLTITARDMLRFGYLFLKRGVWDGKQVISEEWIDYSTKKQTDIEKHNIEKSLLPGIMNSYASHWWCIDEGSQLCYYEDEAKTVKKPLYKTVMEISDLANMEDDNIYNNYEYLRTPIREPLKEGDVYRATGYAGQYIYVSPKYDLVVVMTNSHIDEINGDTGNYVFFDMILPWLCEESELVEMDLVVGEFEEDYLVDRAK